MNKPVTTPSQSDPHKTFPASVLSVSRHELGKTEDNSDAKNEPLILTEKDGKILPSDLQGHAFIIGATGSIDSPLKDVASNTVLPSKDGTTPLYNGDGMVYRIDFNNLTQTAQLSSRRVKTPCYYADVATNHCEKYQGSEGNPKSTDLRFKNLGITRVSGPLGTRNQLNTAFLPLKFSEAEHERLLVTWDVGRPYEIDPKTLETVTPVGKNSEWEEVNKVGKLFLKPTTPFKTIQSSAHPVFDPYKHQMFTVNVGRSLSNVLSQFIPLVYVFQEFIDWIKGLCGKLTGNKVEKTEELLQVGYFPPPEKFCKNLFLSLLDRLKIAGKSCRQFLRALVGIFTDNFLYLVRWDGSGDFQKWQVLHCGFPLKIKQSTHQMGLTEDYLVLIDTAFKLSVEEILPTLPNKRNHQIEKFLRNLLDHPQLKDNPVYIINRGDLKPENKSVHAKKVTIPREAAHFLVDYRNPDAQITLHLAHVCAWDAAEWVTSFDSNNPNNSSPSSASSPLYGAIAGPMDISKLGCHVINGKTGEFIRTNQDILMHEDYTWGAAIYAYRERPFPDRLEDIYWSCLGCWADLKTPHIERLYKDYQYREIGLESLDDITNKGKPSTLFRLHIAPLDSVTEEQNRLSIPDGYQFPEGHWVVSPQFIPRSGTEGSTEGYILCVVHYGDGTEENNGNELWIFDAADLKSGPQYKLWHPQFNVGFTIHTAWLPTLETRNASYCIEMRDDYADILNQQSPKNKSLIQDLFENWIYPKKEPQPEPKS